MHSRLLCAITVRPSDGAAVRKTGGNEYAQRVTALLLEGEEIIDAYKAMRDGGVFTNKRIIAVNAYAVETSGTFDLDSELEISKYISRHLL